MFRRLRPDAADIERRARSRHRSTWAAIGAAVAVTVGALGSSVAPTVSATRSTGERAAYVPIAPCRLIDTRPDTNIGVVPGTVGPDETYVIQVRGNPEPCPATIPADASALAINVTALDQTSRTFLTFWADGDRPTTSNLNPAPGQPPTPNLVNVPLGSNGSFQFFNRSGEVHVIIDVAGFYVDHDHDDRYYTEAEADSRFARTGDVYTRVQADGRFVQPAEVYTRSEADARFGSSTAPRPTAVGESGGDCFADGTRVGGLRQGVFDTCVILTAGTAESHQVHITASTSWFARNSTVSGVCELRRDGTVVLPNTSVDVGETVETTSVAAKHRLSINTVAGPFTGAATYELACREVNGDIDYSGSLLSVIVLPT
ncbi:MAG: hypothetical protein AAGG08_05695 [Actinomycetota bacterium]